MVRISKTKFYLRLLLDFYVKVEDVYQRVGLAVTMLFRNSMAGEERANISFSYKFVLYTNKRYTITFTRSKRT